MKIGLGADHAGYALKAALAAHLASAGHQVVDYGTGDPTRSVDYPDYAQTVGHAVISRSVDLGILVCGTGIGMSIAANKVQGIRAALAHDVTTAWLARQHNDANVLCLGGRLVAPMLATAMVDAWLEAAFETRHQPRVDRIAEVEREEARGRR